MISPDDLSQTQPSVNTKMATAIDVEQDVIPIYSSKKAIQPPSLFKVSYDILMVIAIGLDLAMIFFDKVVMSTFFAQVATYFNFVGWLSHYKASGHLTLAGIGGLFTLFLIVELSVRWVIAIKQKTYYRWFFFPFVHWYEVLGCFPLLRPLRLLRGIVIIRRLHEMNIKIVPNRWIKTAKFYGHILLEELSDRVILTAVDNFRMQLSGKTTLSLSQSNFLIDETIAKNRDKIEQAVLVLLRAELLPKLNPLLHAHIEQQLSVQVGQAVEKSLVEMPQLHRYLRLIPIAGAMIESQVADIGGHIGKNVASSVNDVLLSADVLDELMVAIAKGVASVDTTHPEVVALVQAIIHDGLNAFEEQVKFQQWKHTEHLHL